MQRQQNQHLQWQQRNEVIVVVAAFAWNFERFSCCAGLCHGQLFGTLVVVAIAVVVLW